MKRWTKEEIAILEDLVQQGYLYREIGSIMNRSTRSVQGKCNNLHITNSIHRNTRNTNKSYDSRLKDIRSNMIRIGDYVSVTTPILHKCSICEKEYLCRPCDKLAGYEHCGRKINCGGVPIDKPAITYLVYIPKYTIYKIGITSKSVKERMQDMNILEYESILELHFNKGLDAMSLETEWLIAANSYLLNTGNTETFKM